MNELCFTYAEMTALGDLIASLNKNGIGYTLSKDDSGVYIKISKGF